MHTHIVCMYICMLCTFCSVPVREDTPILSSYTQCARMPERSKGFDSSSNVFVLVGSNPTSCRSFLDFRPQEEEYFS